MKKVEVYSVSVGVLGAIDTYLRATLIKVLLWVTFIAWASFFILDGKSSGMKRSIASNLTGILIASLTLLTIATLRDSPASTAICIGVGSAEWYKPQSCQFCLLFLPLCEALPQLSVSRLNL